MRTACRYDVTLYDASYVALAAILNAMLYTADEGLTGRTTQVGIVKHLRQA